MLVKAPTVEPDHLGLLPLLLLFFKIEIELAHNVTSVSGVQHSDSTTLLCYAVLTASGAVICHHVMLLIPLTTFPVLYLSSP